MALIRCPECGKEISDQAANCINCGYPLENNKSSFTKNYNESIEFNEPIRNRNNAVYLIFLIALIVMGAIVWQYFRIKNVTTNTEKWEHNITWLTNGRLTNETYASIEFYDDDTFKYLGYSKTDPTDRTEYTGTYEKYDNNIIYIYMEIDGVSTGTPFYLNGDKLCPQVEECEDYFVKGANKRKGNITINNALNYIGNADYKKILDDKLDAIVVFMSDTCSHCTNYIEAYRNNYDYDITTPMYFLNVNYDERDDIKGVPTTRVINNGNVVETIEGFTKSETLKKVYEASEKVYNGTYKNEDNTNSSKNTNTNTNDNQNSKGNTTTTPQPKTCDASAKERLTNEYQTTINERTAKHETDMANLRKQIDTIESMMETTGGYLSTEEYERQYAEAQSDTTRNLLKARYGASQSYDKIMANYNQLEPTFNKWKETYTAWYNEELRKINCN